MNVAELINHDRAVVSYEPLEKVTGLLLGDQIVLSSELDECVTAPGSAHVDGSDYVVGVPYRTPTLLLAEPVDPVDASY